MKGGKYLMDEGDNTFDKLYDDLLHYIIDKLPTMDALRTSVLSLRWKNASRSLSNIELDSNWFYDIHTSSFSDIIDRILVQHDSSDIKRFVIISCESHVNAASIYRWINKVIKHNVQELHLSYSFSIDDRCILPYCLFKSKFLTVLKIRLFDHIIGSTSSLFSVHLPNLKILELTGSVFSDNHSTQQFFSNIPKLQQLYLYKCVWEKVNLLIIDIPTLEKFDAYILNRHNQNLNCRVIIVAPVLTSFSCRTDFSVDIFLSKHSLPLNVNVHLPMDVYATDGNELALIRLLESVKTLISLDVCWNQLLNSRRIADNDFSFINMTKLNIFAEFLGDVNLKKILMFLHKTPNLLSFTITLPPWSLWDFEEYDWSSDDIPSCVINQIKEVRISSNFYDKLLSCEYAMELCLIKYFMSHSRSLKMLEVKGLISNSCVMQVMDEIVRHPRYSELKNLLCSINVFSKPSIYRINFYYPGLNPLL